LAGKCALVFDNRTEVEMDIESDGLKVRLTSDFDLSISPRGEELFLETKGGAIVVVALEDDERRELAHALRNPGLDFTLHCAQGGGVKMPATREVIAVKDIDEKDALSAEISVSGRDLVARFLEEVDA
jgi:hypothetical protein